MSTGPLTTQTSRLINFMDEKCQALVNGGPSEIRNNISAIGYYSVRNLHTLAGIVESIVKLIIAVVKTCAKSLKEKTIAVKNFVSDKAQAVYNKIKSFGGSKVQRREVTV